MTRGLAWRLLLGATLGLCAATGAFAQGPLVIARAADGERYDPARVTSRSVGDLVFLLADTLLSQVSLLDPSIGWSKLRSQEYDAFPMSYPYLSVADAYGSYFASSAVPPPNRMNWKDARTDDLLARGAAARTDDERRHHFDEVQMLIQDAAVWLPIVHERLFLTATARLDGVRAHGIDGCGICKGLDVRWR